MISNQTTLSPRFSSRMLLFHESWNSRSRFRIKSNLAKVVKHATRQTFYAWQFNWVLLLNVQPRNEFCYGAPLNASIKSNRYRSINESVSELLESFCILHLDSRCTKNTISILISRQMSKNCHVRISSTHNHLSRWHDILAILCSRRFAKADKEELANGSCCFIINRRA